MNLASMFGPSMFSSWLAAGEGLLHSSAASPAGSSLMSLFGGQPSSASQGSGPSAPQVSTGTAAYTPGAPTRAQLQNAAADAYFGATPAGMRPFMVNGQQMSVNNMSDGTTAKAWITPQNKIVIAYEGTNISNPSSLLADIGVAARTTTPGETDSLAFARSVAAAAHQQGYSSSDVFVTGHSLGGIEAEYVASRTGLGGASFDATGIPVSSGEAKGNNFTSYIQDGDPVSSYASDVQGDQPFAPTYVAAGGSLPHYGHLVTEGNPAAQADLAHNISTLNLAGIAADFVEYHLPGGIPGGMA